MTEAKRRQFVGFRIGAGGLAAVDVEAEIARATRSQMLRLLLALGLERWRAATPAQRRTWRQVHGIVDEASG